MQNSAHITLSSPEQTCGLAKKLASKLEPGNVVLLHGDIGAGKTHFARCCIQSVLTIPEDIPSPTFTLVQTYDTNKGDLWHADLYRLGHADEVIELGLYDAFTNAVCLIEWPDRLGDTTPENALNLHFELGDHEDSRNVTLVWSDPLWNDLLKDVLNDS